MDRLPVVVWAGAALLGYVAGEMFMTDRALSVRLGDDVVHHWETGVALGFAALVVAAGWLLSRSKLDRRTENAKE